jgi:hypothetical protein
VWRAFFFAVGIYAIILGCECLVLDKVELSPAIAGKGSATAAYRQSNGNPFQNSVYQYQPATEAAKAKSFRPREWMPWSLIASGILIVVYTRSYKGTAPAG